MQRLITAVFVLLMCALPGVEAWAAQAEEMGSLRGTVRDEEGTMVHGALIKIRNLEKNITVAVFSERGNYLASDVYPGPSEISASLAGHAEGWRADMDILPGKENLHSIALDKDSKPILTPSDWISFLPDDGDGMKGLFINRCVNCHGPEPIYRHRLDSLGWKKVLVTMQGGFGSNTNRLSRRFTNVSDEEAMTVTGEENLQIVAYLTKNFGPDEKSGKPSLEPVTYRTAHANSNVIFTQFDIPTRDSQPHNVFAAKNGDLWFAERAEGKIGRLDPKTGQFREFPIPDGIGLPRPVVEDQQGNIWWGAGRTLAKMDPQTGQWKLYSHPEGFAGSHTIVIGHDGMVYMTNNQSEYRAAIISFNPQTETFKQYPIKTKHARPYGIAVDSHNHIWFCYMGGNKIGMLDPTTEIIKEYSIPTPHSGPRRPAVDGDDNVWFVEYNTSKLGRLDHDTGKITEWDVPTENSAPYELAIDPRGIVWFSEFGANKLGRFDPATSQFTEYALPGLDSQVRKMTVDPTGDIWLAEFNNSRITRVVEKR
jgi:virginiamycin B lyase